MSSEPLLAVSGDASFRRYFRLLTAEKSYIVVDAPPEREACRPFIAIADAWLEQEIPVPKVYGADLEQGFMLLEDFGDNLFFDAVQSEPLNAEDLYISAIGLILNIQKSGEIPGYSLPGYGMEKLCDEMLLCANWFFQKLLKLEISSDGMRIFNDLMQTLGDNAITQPQVPVHRDYHSRNLMLRQGSQLGTIDFQDAVIGPITYDLVSLIRDCYISWPADKEESWLRYYFYEASAAGLITSISASEFKRNFDWMGLQRHLKCVGIFSRLGLRDGKVGFLEDIPRTFGYLKQICESYETFSEFNLFLDNQVR